MSDDPLHWEPYDRHWIRLRGPWEVTWVAPVSQSPGESGHRPERVKLPAAWHELFGDRIGTARFARRFQRPTNLDADERVVITLCNVRAEVVCQLNGHPLERLVEPIGDSESSPCENPLCFEITQFLEPTNLLTLDATVDNPGSEGEPRGLWQPVLIEIITPD